MSSSYPPTSTLSHLAYPFDSKYIGQWVEFKHSPVVEKIQHKFPDHELIFYGRVVEIQHHVWAIQQFGFDPIIVRMKAAKDKDSTEQYFKMQPFMANFRKDSHNFQMPRVLTDPETALLVLMCNNLQPWTGEMPENLKDVADYLR